MENTFFTWLFVRGHSIPQWLAWLGLFGSVALVIVLPLMLEGYLKGLITQLVWLPILVFELCWRYG